MSNFYYVFLYALKQKEKKRTVRMKLWIYKNTKNTITGKPQTIIHRGESDIARMVWVPQPMELKPVMVNGLDHLIQFHEQILLR
jgi:hypothetical protein